MLLLRELQLRFLAALTPDSAETGDGAPARMDPVLLALVNGAGSLDASERVRIYSEMYRSRLADVLREDYPRVAACVGDAAFSALAGRYLARHPSTRPSVRHVGGRFADWLAAEATAPPFLGDLARLEWARVEVFDAPDAEPLRLADLERLPPAEWPTLRLRLIPACLLVESAWPVHDIWTAADGAAEEDAAPREPAPTVVRVWREGFSVSHAAMGPAELRAFRLLQQGEPFAEICAAIEAELDAETAARQVGSILLRWLEDGLIARSPL